MKYALVLPDGAADEPCDALAGRTPLDAAQTPSLDWIATHGRQGTVVTVPKGLSPGSDVATLSILGCDPHRYYTGRAPLEAAARGVQTAADDLVFRCNLVTIVDGRMDDFSAGHIGQTEADRLITDLNRHLGDERTRFHSGMSYRNLLVLGDAGDLMCKCTPPHDIPNQSIERHLPTGRDAPRLRELMEQARELLAGHEINLVRRDLNENPATDIWLWGQGRPAKLPDFAERFGVRGAVIAAVDLIRGIATHLNLRLIDVPGATGYLNTDYQAKGAAAVRALDEHDLVIVHVEAPDEAGHQGDAAAKVQAIEEIDRHIAGPLLERLRREPGWRIMVAPDHPTPVDKRVHTADPPPFAMAGTDVHTVLHETFSEAHAARSDLNIDPGHELMEYFLRK